jgi:hypothetical protein
MQENIFFLLYLRFLPIYDDRKHEYDNKNISEIIGFKQKTNLVFNNRFSTNSDDPSLFNNKNCSGSEASRAGIKQFQFSYFYASQVLSFLQHLEANSFLNFPFSS